MKKEQIKKKRKNILKQSFEIIFKGNITEILDKKVQSFGSGAHITIPLKHKGKKAKILIYE